MSGEDGLRKSLETLFDPYDWCNGDGDSQCWVNPHAILNEVLERLKSGAWLVVDNRIYGVENADWDDAIDSPHFRVSIDGAP